MLNPTKPLNCILFVSFCCKLFFIPNHLFVIFWVHYEGCLIGVGSQPWNSTDQKIIYILLLPFWYDWSCIFLLIRCNLWAKYTVDERWSFDSVEPRFSFLWIHSWSVFVVRLMHVCSGSRPLYRKLSMPMVPFPPTETVCVGLSPKPTLQIPSGPTGLPQEGAMFAQNSWKSGFDFIKTIKCFTRIQPALSMFFCVCVCVACVSVLAATVFWFSTPDTSESNILSEFR